MNCRREVKDYTSRHAYRGVSGLEAIDYFRNAARVVGRCAAGYGQAYACVGQTLGDRKSVGWKHRCVRQPWLHVARLTVRRGGVVHVPPDAVGVEPRGERFAVRGVDHKLMEHTVGGKRRERDVRVGYGGAVD